LGRLALLARSYPAEGKILVLCHEVAVLAVIIHVRRMALACLSLIASFLFIPCYPCTQGRQASPPGPAVRRCWQPATPMTATPMKAALTGLLRWG
jgi:hypothetical protein